MDGNGRATSGSRDQPEVALWIHSGNQVALKAAQEYGAHLEITGCILLREDILIDSIANIVHLSNELTIVASCIANVGNMGIPET